MDCPKLPLWHEELHGMVCGPKLYRGQEEWVRVEDFIAAWNTRAPASEQATCPSCEKGTLIDFTHCEQMSWGLVTGLRASKCDTCGEDVVLAKDAAHNDKAFADSRTAPASANGDVTEEMVELAAKRHCEVRGIGMFRAWESLTEESRHGYRNAMRVALKSVMEDKA